jgi:predicted GNAT family acetyltransferase
MTAFDNLREAGFSEQDIADYAFRTQAPALRQAGYSDEDISQYISGLWSQHHIPDAMLQRFDDPGPQARLMINAQHARIAEANEAVAQAMKPVDDQMPGLAELTIRNLLEGPREFGQGLAAIGGVVPRERPVWPEEKPIDVFGDPLSVTGKKFYAQLLRSSPTLAGMVGLGTLGSAIGPEGSVLGALAGGMAGGGLTAGIQSLGRHLREETDKSPDDPHGNYRRALMASAQDSAFMAASVGLFGIAPWEQAPLKNLLFQAIGVQPAASAAEQAITNIEQGQPVGQGVPSAAISGAVGTLVPAAAMEPIKYGGRLLRGKPPPRTDVPPPPPPPPDTKAAAEDAARQAQQDNDNIVRTGLLQTGEATIQRVNPQTGQTESIGSLPTAQDMTDAAKIIGAGTLDPATRDGLLNQWLTNGVHPGEIAADSKIDPGLARFGEAPTAPPPPPLPPRDAPPPERVAAIRLPLVEPRVEPPRVAPERPREAPPVGVEPRLPLETPGVERPPAAAPAPPEAAPAAEPAVHVPAPAAAEPAPEPRLPGRELPPEAPPEAPPGEVVPREEAPPVEAEEPPLPELPPEEMPDVYERVYPSRVRPIGGYFEPNVYEVRGEPPPPSNMNVGDTDIIWGRRPTRREPQQPVDPMTDKVWTARDSDANVLATLAAVWDYDQRRYRYHVALFDAERAVREQQFDTVGDAQHYVERMVRGGRYDEVGHAAAMRETQERDGLRDLLRGPRAEQLLPPKGFFDRIWDFYARRMTPEEFLRSDPAWSGARVLAEQWGWREAEAFSYLANEMFSRMGATQRMSPKEAARFMARERGIAVVPDEPAPSPASVGEDVQAAIIKDWSRFDVLTPEARARESTLALLVERELMRMLGRDFVHVMVSRGAVLKGVPQFEHLQTAAGAQTGVAGLAYTRTDTAGNLVKGLIRLALGERELLRTTAHEGFHIWQDYLATDREIEILDRGTEEMRRNVVAAELKKAGKTDAQIADWPTREVWAEAFDTYWKDRKAGVPHYVRPVFDKFINFLNRLRNGLRGLGFRTYRDIFRDIYEGEASARQRAMRVRPGTETLDELVYQEFLRGTGLASRARGEGERSFTTAMGSQYVVHENGQTTRNKAARDVPGHEGDFGPQPRSEKTYYLTPENANRLAIPSGARVRYVDHGNGTLTQVQYHEATGKWGTGRDPVAGNHRVPAETEPRVGLIPFELWKKGTTEGYNSYSGWHFGNPITEVRPGIGGVTAQAEFKIDKSTPGIAQIYRAELPEGVRGQGLGVQMYEQAAREAAAEGRRLASDAVVSADAEHVWQALKRRGYDVVQNPAARRVEGGGLSTRVEGTSKYQGPVFEIQGAPRAAPEPASYATQLAAALGDDTKFPEVYHRLKNEPREVVVAAANEFYGPVSPGTSKNKALARVLARHAKLMSFERGGAPYALPQPADLTPAIAAAARRMSIDPDRLGEIQGDTILGAMPNMYGRLRDGREMPMNAGADTLWIGAKGGMIDPRLLTHFKSAATNNEWFPVKGERRAVPEPTPTVPVQRAAEDERVPAPAPPAPGPAPPAPETEPPAGRVRGPRATGRAAADPDTWNLVEFLTSRDNAKPGLKPIAELTDQLGRGYSVPGMGRVFRTNGMTLDEAMPAAIAGGYLSPDVLNDADGGHKKLVEAITTLALKEGQVAERPVDVKAERDKIELELVNALELAGTPEDPVELRTFNRAVQFIEAGHERNPQAAYRRALMEEDEHATSTEPIEPRTGAIPGFDDEPPAGAPGEGRTVEGEPVPEPAIGGAREDARPPGERDGAVAGGPDDKTEQSAPTPVEQEARNRSTAGLDQPLPAGAKREAMLDEAHLARQAARDDPQIAMDFTGRAAAAEHDAFKLDPAQREAAERELEAQFAMLDDFNERVMPEADPSTRPGGPGDTWGGGAPEGPPGTGGTGDGSAGSAARAANEMNPPNERRPWMMNIVQRMMMLPQMVAKRDPIVAGLEALLSQQFMRTNQLMYRGTQFLKAYKNLPRDARLRLNAIMELIRHRDADYDPAAQDISMRNNDLEHTEYSRIGDVVSLSTPAEMQAYHQMRQFFQSVLPEMRRAMAIKLEVDPNLSIAELVNRANRPGERNREHMLNVATLLAAIENASRKGYIPFGRYGDYYIDVRPRTAEGDPREPSTFFRLVETRSGFDRMAGRDPMMRDDVTGQMVPRRALAELQRVRARFAGQDVEISHGQFTPTPERLREVGLPALERVMLLMSQDIERNMKRQLGPGATSQQIRASVLQFWQQAAAALVRDFAEETKRGFQKRARNTFGYDPDFGRVIGDYVNSTSHYIANLEFSNRIDRVLNNEIATHRDENVREYVKERMNDLNRDPHVLDGPARLARQGAFLWGLGLNFSSFVMSILHDPTKGSAVLGMAFGAANVHRAWGRLLGAMGDTLRGIRISAEHGFFVDPEAIGFRNARERAFGEMVIEGGLWRSHGGRTLAGSDAIIDGPGEFAQRGMAKGWTRLMEHGASLMHIADMVNRSIGLAAFREFVARPEVFEDFHARTMARDNYYRSLVELNGKSPETAARYLIEYNASATNPYNRARVMRGFAGQTLFQFKTYTYGYLSTLHDLAWHQGGEGKLMATMMLGLLGALGGVGAMPFAQDAKDGVDWLIKTIFGIDPDFEQHWEDTMDAMGVSKMAADGALHGWPYATLGVDIGTRLGFGEEGRRLVDSPIGAAPSISSRAVEEAWHRYQTGQPTSAIVAAASPNFLKSILLGQKVWPEQGVMTQYGQQVLTANQLTPADRWWRTMGYQPSDIAQAYEERVRLRDKTQFQAHEAANFHTRVAIMLMERQRALHEGDNEAVTEIDRRIRAAMGDAQARELITSGPGLRRAITDRIRQMMDPQRALITKLPKNQRQKFYEQYQKRLQATQ